MRRVNRRGGVGSMIHRIDVETASIDETTGQPIRTWITTLRNEPAAWTPTAGAEVTRGRQVEAGIAGIFTVNFNDVYHSEQRIQFEGEYYGIVYVKPIDGGRRYIELHVRGVDDGTSQWN